MVSFREKLEQHYKNALKPFIVMLSPRVDMMPIEIQRYDEPFLPFAKSVINATRDIVAGYMFDLPAYMTLGAVGLIALERSIDYAGSDTLTILHGGFSLPSFAQVMDENAFGVDAVTISSTDLLEAFSTRRDKGVFVLEDKVSSSSVPFYSQSQGYLQTEDKKIGIRVLFNDVILEYRSFNYESHLRTRISEISLDPPGDVENGDV